MTESYWGFSVKNPSQTLYSSYIVQGLSLFIGASFLAASIGLFLMPAKVIQSDTLTMRLGLSLFFSVISWLMISYANRGVTTELQIDCNLCEVREVLKKQALHRDLGRAVRL